MAKILVADDEHAICEVFTRLLTLEGHETVTAGTGQDAIRAFDSECPDAVFLDVRLPDMSGLDVLAELQRQRAETPIIIITAHGTVETAMQALERGAFDYLGKPLALADIRALLQRALHRPEAPVDTAEQWPQTSRMVGTSRAMQEIFKLVGLLTTNDLTVLITGESGVGKDLVARCIHENGPRRTEPFVAVNCAAISEHLLESELFGHEQGAFTDAHSRRIGRFEAAGKGTLFLDEIAELPLHLQAKLLRVLQERTCERVGGDTPIPVKARIIAATNQALDAPARSGNLREDLYYRLSLVNLHIPPLRERKGDIPALARFFLDRAAAGQQRKLGAIEPAALARLENHDWPGNVRELEHTIARSVMLARGTVLTVHDLVFDTSPVTRATAPAGRLDSLANAAKVAFADALDEPAADGTQPYHRLVRVVEQALAEAALARCNGNQVAASELLGINRTTLRNKLPQ